MYRSMKRPHNSWHRAALTCCFRPALEALESRVAPAVFIVTNIMDSGIGSLRQAMLEANNTLGPDAIHFNIATTSKTISVVSPLPTITEAVSIDGTTQSGFSGVPLIRLDGATAGSASGLTVAANGCS